jgi:hypothetical protein
MSERKKTELDWTLRELREYCRGRDCNSTECIFWQYDDILSKKSCLFHRASPCDWDLEDPYKFSEQETRDAEMLARMFPQFKYITKEWTSDCTYLISDRRQKPSSGVLVGGFPSIEPGEIFLLEEIIEGVKKI